MLKGVATPDLRASIKLLGILIFLFSPLIPLLGLYSIHQMTLFYFFIGTKYNILMEKNKMKINKCKNECGPRYEALKKKYNNECLERRRLYNELIELRGNIRVFCRCRPLNSDEISKGYSNVIDFDPLHETELQIICDSSKKQFKFDHVFGPAAKQGKCHLSNLVYLYHLASLN